jgi:hypothetical protein
VPDAYVSADDPAGRISVGVYSDPTRAAKRTEELAALGFAVVTRDLGGEKDAPLWLEVRSPDSTPVSAEHIGKWAGDTGTLSNIACP